MHNIRQSQLYTRYMQAIGWKVIAVDSVFVYVRRILFFPAIAKLQRAARLPKIADLQKHLTSFHVKNVIVEPAENAPNPKNISPVVEPYSQTKTITIDITPSEKEIFGHFTSAKQRGIRRALSLGVTTSTSNDISEFMRLKNKAAGWAFGFLTVWTIKPLWDTFSPDFARILFAYLPTSTKPVAGILLLWHDKRAYYWMAAATKIGKSKHAPSLLVWEALKFAKHQGCTEFDFEGIYDERLPKIGRDWKGFTKFKQGFGGKEVYYPLPYKIKIL